MYLRDGSEEGAAPAELLWLLLDRRAIAVCVIVTMIVVCSRLRWWVGRRALLAHWG